MIDWSEDGWQPEEQGQEPRRWALRRPRARLPWAWGASAPRLSRAEDLGVHESSRPHMSIVSLPEPPAGESPEDAPRRRVRWIGWISRRVFHGPTRP